MKWRETRRRTNRTEAFPKQFIIMSRTSSPPFVLGNYRHLLDKRQTKYKDIPAMVFPDMSGNCRDKRPIMFFAGLEGRKTCLAWTIESNMCVNYATTWRFRFTLVIRTQLWNTTFDFIDFKLFAGCLSYVDVFWDSKWNSERHEEKVREWLTTSLFLWDQLKQVSKFRRSEVIYEID